MKKINSIEQLQQQLGVVRKQRFITNFFLDPIKHFVWITKGDCHTEIVGDTLFVIRAGNGFWNVFYSSSNNEALSSDIKSLIAKYPEQTMMFDIVGREVQCKPLVDILKELGFKEATSLVRMNRMAEPFDYVSDDSIRKAYDTDIPHICNLLHEYFNPQNEQIPYDDELIDYANQGHVLVCEENGRMAGFLIYELSNTTLYLRYWFTHPDFRDKKVGSRLLRKFFDEGKDTKRQLLWVIRTNENAIKRYRHYGFKEENMYDYVLTNK